MESGLEEFSIVFEYFIDRWPINSERPTTLISDSNFGISLIIDNKGRFGVETGKPNTIWFQSVDFVIQPVLLKVVLTRDSNGIHCLYLDGKPVEILRDDLPQNKSLFEKEAQKTISDIEIKVIKEHFIRPDEVMLLNTVMELEQRLRSQEHYDIVKTAGLLRILLVDGGSLIDRTIKQRDIILIFKVDSRYKKQMPPDFPTPRVEHYNPGFRPSLDLKNLSQEEFLNYECLRIEDSRYTVESVIKYFSHVKGGIHFRNPHSKAEKLLAEYEQNTEIYVREGSIDLIRGISRVVIQAILPLLKDISDNQN